MTLLPWLAGAALVALSAQPALAQSEAVSPQAAPPSAGQTVHASDVIGARVVNQHGEAVGKITDLVIDARRIEYAVVASAASSAWAGRTSRSRSTSSGSGSARAI